MLLPTKLYHIYNRANGREHLFIEDENYGFFLQKVSQYILPVAEIYSYCLLPNHFHLLVKIKTIEECIQYYTNLITKTNGSEEQIILYDSIINKLTLFSNNPSKVELYRVNGQNSW